MKWVCHSIAFGSNLIPLNVTSYDIYALKKCSFVELDSTPNSIIGLYDQVIEPAVVVSSVLSSTIDAPIFGINAVGTYYDFSAIVVGYVEINYCTDVPGVNILALALEYVDIFSNVIPAAG